MNRLICIRGHQGSGKSTLASRISCQQDFFHYEADRYFVRPDGEYSFNPRELSMAHAWCQECVQKAIELGDVVVANTFTKRNHIEVYKRVAEAYGAEFVVIRCVGNYQNIHGVPQEKVDKVKASMEEWPGEIIYRTEEDIKCLFQ